MNIDTITDVYKIQLKRHWVAVARRVRPLTQETDISVYYDAMQECVMQINGYVLGEAEHVRRQTVRFPKTWWDAIKERFFPQWLLCYYPAVYTTIEMTADVIYPYLRLQFPNEKAVVIIQKHNISEGEVDT